MPVAPAELGGIAVRANAWDMIFHVPITVPRW